MTKFKQLFSTPRKAGLTILSMLAMTATLGAGTAFAASAIAEGSSIGAENAKNFAFVDAGIDPLCADHVKAKFDYEQGQFVYEVEFVAGNSEYEYWIKASNGAVVKKQVEIITKDGSSAVATAKITLDRAKEIALEDAGLSAAGVTFTKGKLDLEDGISVYDVEFIAGNFEYEYEINAMTGAILDKSKEAYRVTTDRSSEITSPVTTVKPPVTTPKPTETLPAPEINPGASDDGRISPETAKERALQDAGLSAAEVTFTKAELDKDDTVAVYEIEFVTADREYDYEIDARTGAIVSQKVETIAKPEGGATGDIGIEKAKSIALSHAGLTSATFTKAELDKDDTVAVYEIEFVTADREYDYEIDARTGAIVSQKVETIAKPEGGATGDIGIEKAKSIALSHAGLTSATFTKAKLDKEDGQVVYEIEFRKNGMEYEYTICAADGSILECEIERD